jgi:molybdopterin molybdotransferase
MVTFMRIARPVILRLAGRSDIEPQAFRVRTRFAYNKKRGRREWLRVRLARADDGSLEVLKFAREGAGILMSMVESDGLVELAEDHGAIAEGSDVDFIPYSEFRA